MTSYLEVSMRTRMSAVVLAHAMSNSNLYSVDDVFIPYDVIITSYSVLSRFSSRTLSVKFIYLLNIETFKTFPKSKHTSRNVLNAVMLLIAVLSFVLYRVEINQASGAIPADLGRVVMIDSESYVLRCINGRQKHI